MDSATQNMSVVDYYFSLLKNLKPNSKLELISKLSESLKSQEKNEDVTLESLFGAYHADETAEEIIASLKSSRTFTRKGNTGINLEDKEDPGLLMLMKKADRSKRVCRDTVMKKLINSNN